MLAPSQNDRRGFSVQLNGASAPNLGCAPLRIAQARGKPFVIPVLDFRPPPPAVGYGKLTGGRTASPAGGNFLPSTLRGSRWASITEAVPEKHFRGDSGGLRKHFLLVWGYPRSTFPKPGKHLVRSVAPESPAGRARLTGPG